MTESVYDLYGWGSPEVAEHFARARAQCAKHNEKYSSYWTTAGLDYHCASCDQEWLRTVDALYHDQLEYLPGLA